MIVDSAGCTRHPFVSLLALLLWVAVGMVVSTVLGVIVCGFIFGFGGLLDLDSGVNANVEGLKIIQLFSSVGTFIVPAFLFARQESANVSSYLNLNRRLNWVILVLSVIVFFAFTPFIEWTIVQNSHMKLPSFLQGIEAWMRQKEDEMAVLTKQFLIMKSPVDLLVNLIVIAIIPGIGEELVFRGCLQKIFMGWIRNYHAGIWLAAIIFSAIHVQFYGFIPRMLLGALFGYLYYWSKSLWIPMIVHSINNGTAVIGAYILQRNGQSLDKIDEQTTYPVYVAVVSLIIGFILLIIFQKQSAIKEVLDEE